METIVPEGYKKTKFGYIPNEWRIDNFSKVIKPIVREVEKPNEPYWRLGLRSHGKGTFHEFIEDPNSVSMDKLYIVKEDDLIVNITFAWEHAIALAAKKDENKLVSHRFPTYQFTNNNVPLFYKYYVLQPRFKYELENISPGGAGRNRVMSKTDFLKIDVLIPSSKEQTKIAQILTTWDEAIVKQEELIKEKEYLKKGLMQKLLSGEVRFDGFNDEWEEVRLGEIGNPFNGLSGKTGEDFGIGEAKYITYKNIFDYSKIRLGIFENVKISDDEKQNLVQFGDIFFTVSSETPEEVGMSSVLLDNVSNTYLNSFCFGYRLNNFNTLDPYFARFYFRSFQMRDKISRLAQGSTRFNLSKNGIMKLKLKLPSPPEQQKIAEVLSVADDEISLFKNELAELKLQKKALMQKLLTGEVRVKV